MSFYPLSRGSPLFPCSLPLLLHPQSLVFVSYCMPSVLLWQKKTSFMLRTWSWSPELTSFLSLILLSPILNLFAVYFAAYFCFSSLILFAAYPYNLKKYNLYSATAPFSSTGEIAVL